MRVLHVHSGNLYGGIETMLVTMARYRHVCPEMEPAFALCFDGRLREELDGSGVSVWSLGAVRVRNPASVWRARRRLARLLAEERFDSVLVHSAWSMALFGPVIRRAHLKLAFWLHDASKGRHWLERWARRTVPDLAIANSRFTRGYLPNLYRGVPSEVIYPPVAPATDEVDAELRGRIRRELDTPQDAVVIVQVSRMEAWKGHTILLEALARLSKESRWIAWFAGAAERPEEQRYERLVRSTAKALGLYPRVRFLGFRQDVRQVLAAADILCQPNLTPEPFGISLVEGLSMGLAIVTSAEGGPAEIIAPDAGCLVRSGDPSTLASALQSLIGDPLRRRELGLAAVARAGELTNVRGLLARLMKTLASGKSTQPALRPATPSMEGTVSGAGPAHS